MRFFPFFLHAKSFKISPSLVFQENFESLFLINSVIEG
ncbi:unnamed protein product [Ceutorhynchus assimilis]|uniref:Uncharacterized protein n=1 Tax=Ceutorhynchus assimilis TaxID=467358 RepID=A0A9N9MX78_9CUCU|nr:unnamed protein product [Ceutorhynchus assimilis]